MRFTFIHEHRDRWPVEGLCRVLQVSARGYRAWASRATCRRGRTDLKVLAHIREHYSLSRGTYGRPRMTLELKEIGLTVGERKVGRLMKINGIRPIRTRRQKVTTDSQHPLGVADNLLGWGFSGRCAQPEMSRRYQLYLDRRRLALSGRRHRFIQSSCGWLGGQRPDEEGLGHQGP